MNYDIPNSPDVYVHRIGRTGRAGESGRAVTLITPKQRRELEAIERHAKTELAEWSPGQIPAARPDRPDRRNPAPATYQAAHPDGVPYVKLVLPPAAATGWSRRTSWGGGRHTHLENDDVRHVRVLERFSFSSRCRSPARGRWRTR